MTASGPNTLLITVSEAMPFLQFANWYYLPTFWIIYIRNECCYGENITKYQRLNQSSVINKKIGGSTHLLKSKTLTALYDIKKSITLLPGFVNPCFRVWLFQWAEVNEQIKNQIWLYRVSNKIVGLQITMEKRERERKGGGALKPIELGLKESHQSIAMKEPHLNFDSEK